MRAIMNQDEAAVQEQGARKEVHEVSQQPVVEAEPCGMNHSGALQHLLALGCLTLASACHEPISPPDAPDSATDGSDIFPDKEETGTSSSGEPPDSSVPDDCTLIPDDTVNWERFTCSGEVSVSLVFEYHGDPDVPVHEYIPCIDFSDGQATEPSYVYTCFVIAHKEPFGPDIDNPYVEDVDACCLADSPSDVVEDFCEVNAAEELCLGTVNALDELRKKIPQIGSGAEIYDQLTNLNKHIATNEAQTSCAKALATEMLADEDTPDWSPEVKDPSDGWPWLQAIDLNIPWITLDDPKASGSFCGEQYPLEELECEIDGLLVVDGPIPSVSVPVHGQASLGTDTCATGDCAVQLGRLEVDVPDLELGPWQLGEIHASLLSPADGRREGSNFRIPGRQVHLEAEFSVAGEEPWAAKDGKTSVGLSADGEIVGVMTEKGFELDELVVTSWPLTIRLTELHSTCR